MRHLIHHADTSPAEYAETCDHCQQVEDECRCPTHKDEVAAGLELTEWEAALLAEPTVEELLAAEPCSPLAAQLQRAVRMQRDNGGMQ